MTTINIIIVDDHEIFRDTIRAGIELGHPDITITGEAETGSELFALLKSVAVDVVLLDISLPDMNGIDIARRLKTECPALKILAISADNTIGTIQEMLLIGIEGFLSKSASRPDAVAEAIRSIMQGVEYFGRDISDIIRHTYVAKMKTKEISTEFSEQERRIIELCHARLLGKDIADRLCISLRTVNWHKSNIFRKLGINSTYELVQFAVQNGIISIDN